MTVKKRLALSGTFTLILILTVVLVMNLGISMRKDILDNYRNSNSSINIGREVETTFSQSLNLFNSSIVLTMLGEPDLAHARAKNAVNMLNNGYIKLKENVFPLELIDIANGLSSQLERGYDNILDDDSYGASELFRDSISEQSELFIQIFKKYQDSEVKKLKESQTKAEQKYLVIKISFYIILTVLIIMFFIYIRKTSNYITRGLVTIINGADQFKLGNYSFEIDISGDDELSQLSDSLTEMANSITAHEKDKKVQFEKLDSLFSIIIDSSEQVSQNSSQLQSISSSVSSSSIDLTSKLQNISNSIDSISNASELNEKQINSTLNLASESSKEAEEGDRGIKLVVESIFEINGIIDKITSAVKIIDEITMQTDILALNAAVEAARAGENGAGFAVVANEVRDLAHRSAVSAKEISELVFLIADKTRKSQEEASGTAKSISEIVSRIDLISKEMGNSSTLAFQEKKSVEDIKVEIKTINILAQNLAASAEEGASASDVLSSQATILNSLTDKS